MKFNEKMTDTQLNSLKELGLLGELAYEQIKSLKSIIKGLLEKTTNYKFLKREFHKLNLMDKREDYMNYKMDDIQQIKREKEILERMIRDQDKIINKLNIRIAELQSK